MAAGAAEAAETAEPADRACTEKNRNFLSIEWKRRIFDGCSMTSKGEKSDEGQVSLTTSSLAWMTSSCCLTGPFQTIYKSSAEVELKEVLKKGLISVLRRAKKQC